MSNDDNNGEIPPVEAQLPESRTRDDVKWMVIKWVVVPCLVGLSVIYCLKSIARGVEIHV